MLIILLIILEKKLPAKNMEIIIMHNRMFNDFLLKSKWANSEREMTNN